MQRERRHGTFVEGQRYRQVYVLATRVCFPENLLGKEKPPRWKVWSGRRASSRLVGACPQQHLAEEEIEGRRTGQRDGDSRNRKLEARIGKQ
jgi:hypothetical protein